MPYLSGAMMRSSRPIRRTGQSWRIFDTARLLMTLGKKLSWVRITNSHGAADARSGRVPEARTAGRVSDYSSSTYFSPHAYVMIRVDSAVMGWSARSITVLSGARARASRVAAEPAGSARQQGHARERPRGRLEATRPWTGRAARGRSRT